MKKCTQCLADKEFFEFSLVKNTDRYRNRCKPCRALNAREKRKDPKQKKKNGVLVEYRSEKQKSIIGTLVSKPFKGCMFISDCVYHDWEEYL